MRGGQRRDWQRDNSKHQWWKWSVEEEWGETIDREFEQKSRVLYFLSIVKKPLFRAILFWLLVKLPLVWGQHSRVLVSMNIEWDFAWLQSFPLGFRNFYGNWILLYFIFCKCLLIIKKGWEAFRVKHSDFIRALGFMALLWTEYPAEFYCPYTIKLFFLS